MRTIRIPLMGVWGRQEFLAARHAKAVYELGEDIPPAKTITCSFCRNLVQGNQIHVVEYGDKVACQKCFKIRYMNRRQLYRDFPIPSDLDERLDSIPQKSPEEYKAAVDKAVEIQDNNIRQLRESVKKQKD